MSFKYVKTIDLQIDKELNNPIEAKQGDTARYLLVNIKNDDGTNFDLTDKMVRLCANKPDKKQIFNDCEVLDAKNGQIEIQLTTQILAVTGWMKCELIISDDNNSKLSTMCFTIDVVATNLDNNAIESTNEFTALDNALIKVEKYNKYFSEIIGEEDIEYNKDGITDWLNATNTKAYATWLNDDEPVKKNGDLTVIANIQPNADISKKIKVYLLDKDSSNENKFKVVNSKEFDIVIGKNILKCGFMAQKGQYVAIGANNALLYKNGVEDKVGKRFLGQLAEDGSLITFTEYKGYVINFNFIINYEGVTKETFLNIYDSLSTIQQDIKDLKEGNTESTNTPDYSKYACIGTNYYEKFNKTTLPVAPYGTWENIGNTLTTNGIRMAAKSDWSNYLRLKQRMNLDSDGTKWRIKLVDKTSQLVIERRCSDTRKGFSTIVALDNGILKLYQTEKTETGVPSTVIAQKKLSMNLEDNREYVFTLECFAENIYFTIADTVTGNRETLSYCSTSKGTVNAGRCWDYPTVRLLSGSATILDFTYFSRLPKSPRVVMLGDSLTEADTIRNEIGGGYTNRWSWLVSKACGYNAVILGTAGEKSTEFKNKINWLTNILDKPQYVFIGHMSNDSDFNTWKTNTESLITKVKEMGAIPIIIMFPMRTGRESFYDSVLEYVNNCDYKVVWLNRALTQNGDGKTKIAKYFLSDDLHWTVAGHKRAFEQFKVDLEEIFQLA